MQDRQQAYDEMFQAQVTSKNHQHDWCCVVALINFQSINHATSSTIIPTRLIITSLSIPFTLNKIMAQLYHGYDTTPCLVCQSSCCQRHDQAAL